MDSSPDRESLPPLRSLLPDLRSYIEETPRKSLVILLLAPILITLNMRFATVQNARVLLPVLFPSTRLTALHHWYFVFCVQCFLLYLIPALIVRFAFGERLTDYGHRISPIKKLWPLALIFLAAMMPITYLASLHPSFSKFYPLYADAVRGWDHFIGFEAGLFCVFFAQEFFFRGFIIDGLAPHFGYNAILISTGIYGVAHYTKPIPEQLGAFFVGNLLGYLGLRYRTFLFGVFVHYGVAFAMDAILVIPALLRARGK